MACDVMLLPIAYAVWNSVKETYAREGNIQCPYELCEGIFFTIQESKPLHERYSAVKSKWEELSLYQPFPADMTTQKK